MRPIVTEATEQFLELSDDWACPCCRRTKRQIRRESGYDVIGKTAKHHDHLTNYPVERLKEFKSKHRHVPGELRHFADRVAKLILGFPADTVCEDCNNADTRAKQLVGAPKHFSFALSEIREFIVQKPNSVHQVDATRAAAVFVTSKQRFDQRMAVATRLMDDAIVHGVYWVTLDAPMRAE